MYPVAAARSRTLRQPTAAATQWQFIAMGQATDVASGNLTMVEPAGAQDGDLLVAFLDYRSTPAFTLPAGWSLVATQQSGGDTTVNATSSIASGLMAYIVRSGTPALTFTRTAGDQAGGAICAYRGNTPTPYDTGNANTLATTSVTATIPSLTTAEDNELLVAGVSSGRNNTVSAFVAQTEATTGSGAAGEFTTAPAINTWTQRRQGGTATGADNGIGMADAIKATAGACGIIQATASTSAKQAMVVGAFKKAA